MDLEQRLSVFGGTLNVSVNNDDVLVIKHKKLMNTSTTRFLLDNIDPRYESFRQFSIISAITSVVCLITSLYLVWHGQTFYEPPDDGVFWLFAFISFAAFLMLGIKAYNSRVNIVCFNSHDGRRLFSILGNKPSSEIVEVFCEKLGKRIERIRYSGEISSDRMSEILKQHVEFLFEQSVLTEAEAKTAIERISSKSKISVVDFGKKEGL